MRYKVIWHSRIAPGQYGPEFEVDAPTLHEAWFAALAKMRDLSSYLSSHVTGKDLEALVDDAGTKHDPTVFTKSFSPCDLGQCPAFWKELLHNYKQVVFHSAPEYDSITDRELGSITTGPDDGGHFLDRENVVYFLSLPSQELARLCFPDEIGPSLHFRQAEVLRNFRMHNGTIGQMLRKVSGKDKEVTHILCSDELYGGYEHSVWRDYVRADIYEVPRR